MSPPRRERRGQLVATESTQLDMTATFAASEPVLALEADVDRDFRVLQREAFKTTSATRRCKGSRHALTRHSRGEMMTV